MKTFFKSPELWDVVETGIPEGNANQLREHRKRDSKALFRIQQALDDEIFPHISAAETSKQAWEILKQEYFGDDKGYLSRTSAIVNRMRSYAEKIDNQIVVSKVLRSLTTKFEHVVTAIEESKDLSIYSFDELMSSLLAHEDRLNRSREKVQEKAFQVKGEFGYKGKAENSAGCGHGRGNFRGRGCGGSGRGNLATKKLTVGRSRKLSRRKPISLKMWKKKVNCLSLVPKLIESVNVVWFIDSECSNHMSSSKSLFRDLDESQKSEVRLGDDKQVHVEGKGTIEIKTVQGNVKLLYDVQYVPTVTTQA
ncbi:uncharacterized protein LOC125864099 [Solanum stenotomum]|uniref:uncharacterized protein LOC125864099 n=1 Tax=Solanum stenotomum TaxID=172797 RepID=UPI0020D1F11C|nr:uncharacterized protein LOC125864099 [Solanum stenotomum]